MKGLGMGESRVGAAWVTARRAVVAAATAAVIVGVGSRVNPEGAAGWSAAPSGPRVVDTVLADVRLDESSLPKLVDSINQAAGRRVVRLETTTLSADSLDEVPQAAQRLRDVRVGEALAVSNWLDGGGIEWREEAGEIVIGGPGTARAVTMTVTECRLYDVRDIVAEAGAWTAALHGRYPGSGPGSASPGPSLTWLAGGWSGADVANSIRWAVDHELWDDPRSGWRVAGVGGWVFVRAGEAGHRHVEQLLTILRRGDSGARPPVGGER